MDEELHTGQRSDRIERDGLIFAYLKDSESFSIRNLQHVDAVILNASSRNFSAYIIKKIRGHNVKKMYLMPIFLYNKVDYVDSGSRSLTDGVVPNINYLQEAVTKTKAILRKAENILEERIRNYESFVLRKTLSYMYTRGQTKLEPVMTRNSKLGYSFPILSANYDFEDEHKVLDKLTMAEEEGYFVSKFIETIYLCDNCFNGLLTYREVCPKCAHPNLAGEDLIHHFPCAYVGPHSDYTDGKRDDEMICPKCNKHLHHIGVDYDKPSKIYGCNECGHQFQDFNVFAKCLACGHDTDVENLPRYEVRSYTLTPKGRYAAVEGEVHAISEELKISGTIEREAFETVLSFEFNRNSKRKTEACISCIHWKNAKELYAVIGRDNKKRLIEDLIGIIRRHIGKFDVIMLENHWTFVFSIADTREYEADNITNQIGVELHTLIQDNFKGFEAEVEYDSKLIDPNVMIHTQLLDLTQGVYPES